MERGSMVSSASPFISKSTWINSVSNKILPLVTALLLFFSTGSVFAEFAIVVSPPRFELSMKPGETKTHVVSITSASSQPGKYLAKTADWSFGKDGSVVFSDTLGPGSCRPWVAIESKEIVVQPQRRFGYRVQIEVPPDAPAQECRFALMIEGEEDLVKNASGVTVPVAGRIGVIFYVSIGDVEPQLDIKPIGVRLVQGERVPVLEVKNTGSAHGRLSGFLSGTDAKGVKLQFAPSTFPVLPGETRMIELSATTVRGEPAKVAYPVVVKGEIEWGTQRQAFEQRFE